VSDFLIRPAVRKDAAAVGAIRVATWRHAYAGIMPDVVLDALDPLADAKMYRARWPRKPQALAKIMQVAECDGKVVGFVRSGPYRVFHASDEPEPAENAVAVGEVNAIYVLPKYQGGGIGAALLTNALDILAKRRLNPVALWVLADNAPSRRFYERMGFAFDGGTQLFPIADLVGGSPSAQVKEVRYTRFA
jgi:GNAT superfamily N-acetyltransferase